ncbi:PQQ-dependent sugar dehydrogenase [Devosia sp. XJ19-1]|uniref:PQQ-dependent sugar dehydrogenase n=1 Tax=Devosia ureilytica TaxID=2952754 RepID=A0A9Q4APQ9_9HYPH|nr:PQQ-dependent sugar dehydrogenase [Devosia ureilytica]MCP8883840.1 PQQ-dependent sugar dehydrogenase [Devosia ureilytica]MCP8887448.1 PQQ-dependent sugar dehydrogenase [Devosia ureilytica]
MSNVKKSIAALMLGALAVTPLAHAQERSIESSVGAITARVLAEGLDHPWALAFLPDGRFLVTERSGQMRLVSDNGVGAEIAGVPQVVAQGQGGLLDVVLAPDFAETGRLYLSFSERAADAGAQSVTGTAVMSARLELDGDGGQLVEQDVIFRMNRFDGSTRHFGSRIVIGQDGNLFVTLGERGNGARAQDPADLAGGVVRIAPDGSVPADNPHIEGWAPEFWSIGHRNPQGATLRDSDGALFAVEHGARGGDEVNLVQAGKNYGWPEIAYGTDYDGSAIGVGQAQAGMEQPLHYWDPSISPSGLDFYEGDLFADWTGDLVLGGLSGQVLVRLDMEGDAVVGEERLFEGQLGRIRDVRVGPDGAIYLLTDEGNGRLIRIAPAD